MATKKLNNIITEVNLLSELSANEREEGKFNYARADSSGNIFFKTSTAEEIMET